MTTKHRWYSINTWNFHKRMTNGKTDNFLYLYPPNWNQDHILKREWKLLNFGCITHCFSNRVLEQYWHIWVREQLNQLKMHCGLPWFSLTKEYHKYFTYYSLRFEQTGKTFRSPLPVCIWNCTCFCVTELCALWNSLFNRLNSSHQIDISWHAWTCQCFWRDDPILTHWYACTHVNQHTHSETNVEGNNSSSTFLSAFFIHMQISSSHEFQ